MSDEQSIDAESATRTRKYSEADHLKHLLKIGYPLDSPTVQSFIEEHHLQDYVKHLKQNAKD